MAKTKKAGQFAGGFFNNPGVIILGLGIAALALFRGDIRGAFGSIGEGLVNINLPTINFPAINFPGFPDPIDQFPEAVGGGEPVPVSQPGAGLPNPADMPTDPSPVDVILNPPPGVTPPPVAPNPEFEGDPNQDLFRFNPPGIVGFGVLGPEMQGISENLASQLGITSSTSFQDAISLVNNFFAGVGVAEPQPVLPGLPPPPNELIPGGGGIIVTDPTGGIGGGPSFEGGVTTFGNLNEIVDTLSEVLQIFPGLSASQAADALAASPGLTFGEFAIINPDVINISPI